MIVIDFTLIIISTIIALSCYKKIIFKKDASIANYIIEIIYIFCVLPILFNYILGIPEYSTVYWYKVFIEPMNNSNVNMIYDIYIFVAIISLYLYSLNNNRSKTSDVNKSYLFIFENKITSTILILSPIIAIILLGDFSKYLIYNVSANRGFSETEGYISVTPLLLLSVFTYFTKYFKDKITFKKVIISLVYFFIIVWISGKRFMIANLLILTLFYITRMDIKVQTRKIIYLIIPILILLMIIFSTFYLTFIRPLSSSEGSEMSAIYEMLRVDFGRDDVIKFVINEEFFNHNMILEYRGQSILSLIFFFIPRTFWAAKPYPHYMYLTGRILDLPIDKIPAGTTPSWLEMCLCNFSYWGFLIAIMSLILLCKMADNADSIDKKAIYLMLLIVLLTQSMDVYIIYFAILLIMKLTKLIFKNKKVKIVWGKRRD